MPRPRVKPEDRQRGERACDPCKLSKKRCNGTMPCLACERKGIIDSCTYNVRRRRAHPRTSLKQKTLCEGAVGAEHKGVTEVRVEGPATEDVARRGVYTQPGVIATPEVFGVADPPPVDVAMSGMAGGFPRQEYHGPEVATEALKGPEPSAASMVETPYMCPPEQNGLITRWAPAVSQNMVQRSEEIEDRLMAEQKAVMLVSARGKKVFVGNTAAISFLSLLQNVVKRYIGPSRFTDLQKDRKMLEMDVPEVPCEIFEHSLGDIDSHELINVYLQASAGLFDLFTDAEIANLTHSRPKPTPVPTAAPSPATSASASTSSRSVTNRSELDDAASFYAMIAIGAQCRMRDAADNATATRYFNQARTIAFQGWLQDPTVGLVRTFVLLAFYMLGACRRNAAFMYIGVASKAAIVLGLHASSENKNMDPVERDQRNRVGMSVRVLDLVCSSILGRPGTSLPLAPGAVRLATLDPTTHSHRSLALAASYEVCYILEGIVRDFAAHGSLSVDSTDNFLGQLAAWTRELPSALRMTHVRRKGQRENQAREMLQGEAREEARRKTRLVGNIHMACTYYFGVILVTRQYMIHHVMSKLEMKTSGEDAVLPTESTPGQPLPQSSSDPDGWRASFAGQSALVKKYSDRCIDAALYLAQQCIRAHEGGDLLSIMCALKAWMFVSGLVLGFALLLERTAETERWAAAFNGIKGILLTMSQVSPQARQYSQILGSFSEAIMVYHNNQPVNAARGGDTSVERILAMHDVDEPIREATAYNIHGDRVAAAGGPGDAETNNPGHYFGAGMPAFTGSTGLAAMAGPFEHYVADFTSMLSGSTVELPGQWAETTSTTGGDMSMALPDVMALLDTFTTEFGPT